MTNYGTNARGGIAKSPSSAVSPSKNTKSSGSSSTQVGLNQAQVNQLKGMSGIDQNALNAYTASGSQVGGSNNPTGTGRTGSTFETNYLNSKNIATAPTLTVPPPPTPTDVGNVAGANNIGLATGLAQNGTTLNENGFFVTQPTQTEVKQPDSLQSILETLNANAPKAPDTASIYNKEYKNSGVGTYQQDVNNYTAQLNAITAKQNSDLLSLRGTGSANGVTEAVYGGQQATINREAAIVALPVQAQLAAAQGNLQMAQDHLDTMFKIKSQDAQTKFQYELKKLDTIKEFLTKAEERTYNERITKTNREYQTTQDFLKTQKDALSNALAQGAPASVYNAIKSATDVNGVISAAGKYNGDVLGQQIKQKQLADLYAKPTSTKRDTQVVDGKLIDMQTGEVISNLSGTPASSALGQALSEAKIDNINNILANPALGSVVGPSGLARTDPGLWSATKRFFSGALAGSLAGAGIGAVVGGVGAIPGAIIGGLATGVVNASRGSMDQLTGDRQAFVGAVEQMRSELTTDKLAQAKGQGVTFGALSDGERTLIANAATKLGTWAVTEDGKQDGKVIGYDVNEQDFKREMDVINYFTKLDAVLRGATPESVGAVTNPDGSVWILNSDGTLSQLKH